MFRFVAWAVRKAFEQSPEQELSLAERIRLEEEKLQQEPSTDGKSEKQAPVTKEIVEPTDCFQTIGTITQVKGDYFIIDGIYFVPKSLVKHSEAAKHLEENTRLQFLANRRTDPVSGETVTKVVKIISVIEKLWSDEATADVEQQGDWSGPAAGGGKTTTYYKSNRRREPGTVIEKQHDVLTIETDAGDPISVNIDSTRMSFVPMLGDYVTLDCVVQVDGEFLDFKGEVLDVVGIEPTRLVSGFGTIIAIEEQEGGEIRSLNGGGTIIYQSECCPPDYRPMRGDRVEYGAIENKHVQMRCISVKLLEAAVTKTATVATPSNGSQANDKARTAGGEAGRKGPREGSSIWQDKHGVRITGDFDVALKDGQDRVTRTVTITNDSNRQQKILKMLGPKSATPQVQLTSPYAHTQSILFPGETVEYVFEITGGGGFFGRNEESCVWCFGGSFRIGRWFRITVGDPALAEQNGGTVGVVQTLDGARSGIVGGGPRGTFNARVSYCKKQLALLNMRRAPGTTLAGRGMGGPRANFIANPLPLYSVPGDLYDLMLTTASRAEVVNILERPPYCLREELSPANYSRVWHTFIYLEEIRLQIEFRRHDIERSHFTPEDSYLALEVPNVAEARPSIMVGDTVRASAPWTDDNTIYQGVIHRLMHSRVLLKFDRTFHSRYNGESYAIQFTFGRSGFRKQHHAIKRMQLSLGLEYLFPECINVREPLLNARLNARHDLVLEEETAGGTTGRVLPWCNASLNPYQKQAIVSVLRGEARPLPHIIFGPPGTGKTMTIVELIHQLAANVPSARLIVVTPSNSAAYLITERLARGGVLQPGDFIRLVAMNQVERESIPEHLAQYCATVDVSDERNTSGEVLVTESGLRMKFQAKHIGRHRVTIATCLGVGALMQMHFEQNHFTHVIMDEAGQALEPEALIALCQVSRVDGSVTLVGDPNQLGPVIHFTDGQLWNSNRSLLERLLTRRLYSVDRQRFGMETAGYDPRLVTMLRVNYRSIPSVLSLYNDIFYDGALEPFRKLEDPDRELIATVRDILAFQPAASAVGAVADGIEQSAGDGFYFCGIDGTNKQSPDSPSWFNPAEACMVHKIVERLYRGGRYGPADIGIITPYLMQVRSIRRIFDAATLESPKIGSVEEFQGQERKVIIVSTVRSTAAHLPHDATNKLGFISLPKRINVAISRAKVVLVVVGNPKLLAVDRTWLQVLQRAVSGGTYCGCTLSASLMRVIQATTKRSGANGTDGGELQRQYDDEDEDDEEDRY